MSREKVKSERERERERERQRELEKEKWVGWHRSCRGKEEKKKGNFGEDINQCK